MIFLLKKLLAYLLSNLFYEKTQDFALERTKRKSVLFYLRVLQVVRQNLILAVLVVCVFQMMLFGLLGTIVVGAWLLPINDPQLKLFVLLGVFVALFIIPLLVLIFALSEKVWYRYSGAQDMVETLKREAGQ